MWASGSCQSVSACAGEPPPWETMLGRCHAAMRAGVQSKFPRCACPQMARHFLEARFSLVSGPASPLLLLLKIRIAGSIYSRPDGTMQQVSWLSNFPGPSRAIATLLMPRTNLCSRYRCLSVPVRYCCILLRCDRFVPLPLCRACAGCARSDARLTRCADAVRTHARSLIAAAISLTGPWPISLQLPPFPSLHPISKPRDPSRFLESAAVIAARANRPPPSPREKKKKKRHGARQPHR